MQTCTSWVAYSTCRYASYFVCMYSLILWLIFCVGQICLCSSIYPMSLAFSFIEHCFLSVPQQRNFFVVSVHPYTVWFHAYLALGYYSLFGDILIHAHQIVNILFKRTLPLFFWNLLFLNSISLKFFFSIVFSPYRLEMFWDWSFKRGRYDLGPYAFIFIYIMFYIPFY